VFDDGMQCDEHERVQLRTQLRSALRNGELRIHLQPKIDLASGAVAGAEALVRWQHPEQGLLGPSAFVPLAETSGLIVPIGDWVINETCRLVAAWRAKGLRLGSVSVNISVVQVRRGNLTESVAAALRRWHLPADCLELELTESLLLDDFERATKVTSGLRDLGVKLSIDDFGTGYSSLSYLKQLQVHRLKIDRSFVRDMAHDSNTLAIVKSIVHLGHNLGLAVTAEGVESEGQRSMLREIGCNEIQGFLISRPVDPLAFERWLSDFSAAEASLEAGGR
jgi:EAL domain-containing protein (putative c-di-GMP-specific phosphodiesterase class I)